VIAFSPSVKRAILIERVRATERVEITGICSSLYFVDCYSIAITSEGVSMVTGTLDAIPRETVPIFQKQFFQIGSGIESKLIGILGDASVAIKMDSTEMKKYQWNSFIYYPGEPGPLKYTFMKVPIGNVTSGVLQYFHRLEVAGNEIDPLLIHE
jgi:hypothetical protein